MVRFMSETDLDVGGHRLRIRDAGDPQGSPVLYFHSTPGSRLDMAFADELATEMGVRMVSFDRPGYGGSAPARFGLASIASDAATVADGLGIDRFATLGQSGGGPFALALLPADPVAAARGFARGFEPLVSTFRQASPAQIAAGFYGMLSTRDRELMRDEHLASAVGQSMKEALRQGSTGAGWDNVAWVGQWELDLTTINCPVLLWYGDEDRLCPSEHGVWLRDNLPNADLVLRPGEGHLGYREHTAEMLTALTSSSP
jgi:pimeloyl-ACP methyl ester carboxylesterase